MRDRYVRRVCAGLILAVPFLIHVASPTFAAATKPAGPAPRFPIAPILASEGVLAVGLALAWRARRSLGSTSVDDDGIRRPFLPAHVADPFVG